MNWIQRQLFKLKTGADIEVVNGSKSVDEVAIRYKDLYFSIFVDTETQEPTGDFSWSTDPTMLQTPIRDIWTATPNTSKRGKAKN